MMKKKKKAVNEDNPFLPQNVIRNILKRLPVKSLIRFQCVCRHWRNLFKTQSFITEHLHHSNCQNPYLLFEGNPRIVSSKLYWLDSEMQIRRFQYPRLLDYFERCKIVNSSNGLICVEINNRNGSPHCLLVWNPAIREIRLVPQTDFHTDYHCYFIGFGFSPITKDYKIVITYVSDYYNELSAVKVFSLSSGSWKEVEFRLSGTICLSSRSVTANGVMFWLGSKKAGEDDDDEDDDQNVIVSFDLAMEVFTVIPIPKLYSVPRLNVYEEKLAMFSCTGSSEDSVIHMWVLEEGVVASGERWSWTKKYTSSSYPCRLYTRTIWGNDIVCWADVEDKSRVVLFNPATEKIKKLAIIRCKDAHCIFNYAESLVPVGGMKSFTNFL